MGQPRFLIVLVSATALALSACGFADSRAPVPQFMRAKENEPPPPEAAPDIKPLVRDHLDSIFMAASHPANVGFSHPLHDPRGLGWIACVRAELTSVTGKSLGMQTYRVVIDGGVIADRRRAGPEDTCSAETYEPL